MSNRFVNPGLSKGNYIVGSIHKTRGTFSVASNPSIKMNLSDARREAERLAGMNTEKRFVVWRCEGVVESTSTRWVS